MVLGRLRNPRRTFGWEGPVLKRSGLFHALRFLFGTIPGGPRCRLVRGHANHHPRPSPAALEPLTPVTDLPRLRAFPFGGQSAFRAVSAKRGRPGLKNGGDQRDQENNYENKEENAGYSRCSRGNSSKSKHPGDQCNHSKNERPIKHFGLLCFSSPSDYALASANVRLPSLVAALMKQFMVSRNEQSRRGGPCQ